MRRVVPLAVACLSLAVTGCGGSDTGSATTSAAPTSTAATGAGSANTAEVVAAATAFLGTLSAEQRETVVYEFDDDAKKSGWSNFPTSFVERNGPSLADLDDQQDAAALAVMEAALSDQGYKRLQDIRAADAYLEANQDSTSTGTTGTAGPSGGAPPSGGAQPSGGRPGGGGGGGLTFGEDLYFLAFFGEPSETGQFMVQFGGHHLAYNLTYQGGNVSPFPSLTATEPSQFEWGSAFDPLADEKSSTFAALGALTQEQLANAELDDDYQDLALGPGRRTVPRPAGRPRQRALPAGAGSGHRRAARVGRRHRRGGCRGADRAVLLLAVGLNRAGLGMLMILAFSVGLAAVLVGLGLLLVTATPFVARFGGRRSGWITARLPLV